MPPQRWSTSRTRPQASRSTRGSTRSSWRTSKRPSSASSPRTGVGATTMPTGPTRPRTSAPPSSVHRCSSRSRRAISRWGPTRGSSSASSTGRARARCTSLPSGRDMAAPLRKDQELELTIDSLAYGGNGVARLNGFVVFVRRGLPGDTVLARVTKVKRSHAEATPLEVVRPGAPRVEAPCAHYPACGGCRFQDLAYEAQVDAKSRQLADALARIGKLSGFELEPVIHAESLFHYRNKLEYSFTATPGGVGLGFHKAGRWDEVLDVDRCWLTTDLGNAIRNAVRDWANAEGLAPFDQETQQGYLRHLVVREGRNTGQALVVLVTAP